MNTKKINTSLIFTIILSAICVVFYGYVNFILIIFADLAKSLGGNTDGITNVTVIIILAMLVSILCLINIVFSSISFKYTRHKGEKFDAGKRKLLTLAILLLVNALVNIILIILTFNSVLLMISIALFALSFIAIAVVLFLGVKKINIAQKSKTIETEKIEN